MNERDRTAAALIVLCVLVGAVVAPAAAAGSADAAADGVRAGTAADRVEAAQANGELVAAAREGAARGIDDAAAAGVTATADQRRAVIRAAELGATVSASGISFGVTEGGERAQVSPGELRAAARGAAYGALSASARYRMTDQVIVPAVAGGTAGAALSAAIVPTQGGRVTPPQIRAAAQGGAEGTALAAGEVAAGGPIAVAPDAMMATAFGGATGSLLSAGLLPVYGGSATPVRTYAAALGGASGALVGVRDRADGRLPVDVNQTVAAASGASAGAVSALLRDPDLPPLRLYAAARGAAIGTLGDESLVTVDQIIEAAALGALERLVDVERAPDALFPVPLRIAGQTVPIGPPGDPDSDGRYEDVNGNGVLTYSDVVTLAIVLDSWKNEQVRLSGEQVAAFDFNGDGVFDSRDVRALNEEITGGP